MVAAIRSSVEIPNRMVLEARFGKRMARLTSRHRRELLAIVGSPPDASRVTEEFWQRVQREVEEETAALLLLLFMASAFVHSGARAGELESNLTGQANSYANRTARDIAVRYTTGAKVSLTTRAKEWEPTPQAPGKGKDGEPLQPKPAKPPTKGEVNEGAAKVFGPNKAEEIAISETTDAQSAGGEAAMGMMGLISDNDLWTTEADARVCIICSPLHKKRRPVWAARFPNGPKAHARCRCWLDYAATEGNDKVEA